MSPTVSQSSTAHDPSFSSIPISAPGPNGEASANANANANAAAIAESGASAALGRSGRALAPSYADLTPERAQRLLMARQKTIEGLERRIQTGYAASQGASNAAAAEAGTDTALTQLSVAPVEGRAGAREDAERMTGMRDILERSPDPKRAHEDDLSEAAAVPALAPPSATRSPPARAPSTPQVGALQPDMGVRVIQGDSGALGEDGKEGGEQLNLSGWDELGSDA